MKFSNTENRTQKSKLLLVSTMVVLALSLAGCGAILPALEGIPIVGDLLGDLVAPTPTFTPTPEPTATPTPEPTPTTKPGETPVPPTPTPIPTPEVTIPDGFKVQTDEERGYSLAFPRGWTNLDLRSSQFQNMAGTFGMGDMIGQLNDFLDSEQGQAVGIVGITDLTAVMFGGLPTLLNVSVIDAPGATQEWAMELIEANLDANAGMLGDVEIRDLSPATVNNLPAIRGSAVADLSQVGMNAELFAKVVGLLANDKIYVLTLATPSDKMAEKEPVFDQIIGSFRPE